MDEELEDEAEFGGKMPLLDHLQELRGRILISFVLWVVFSIVGWYYADEVISYFKAYPSLRQIQLILIRPPEAFFVRMKTAMIVGLLAALPIIFYEVLAFVLPGLKKGEKKWILRLMPLSVLLFYGGAAFGLLIMLPFALNFFLISMTKGIAIPQISLEEYVNFLIAITLAGGFIFQTPIVLFFLTMIGILSSEKLARGRRYAIIVIFIVAALASPPDPFSQIVVAIPMLILYEVCIWLAKAAGK